MKIYIHEGKGHWIGSCVIVIAGSVMTADRLIRKELDSGGLKNEELNITQTEIPKKATTIYFNNGDY